MVASALPVRTANLSAERLVAEAQVYSEAAWAQIYDQHYARMFDYCLLRTGNRMVAEDLAADVFLEALRGIARYRYQGVPISAWLYRIAHNLTADFLRRKFRRPTVSLPDEAHDALPRVPDAADRTALRIDLQLALEQLTQDQQQVILLRFFHGLSHDQTAAVMRRRTGAVRVLQNRALKALRRVMAAPSLEGMQ